MSLDWVANQIARRQATQDHEAPRYNPRPSTLMREGSTTELVLFHLVDCQKRYQSHDEIRQAVGKSKTAVDWALIFLRANGLVEGIPKDPRNPRYLRYKATDTALALFGQAPPKPINPTSRSDAHAKPRH